MLTWTRGTSMKAVEGCCDTDLRHHTIVSNGLKAKVTRCNLLQHKMATKRSWHSWAPLGAVQAAAMKEGSQHHAQGRKGQVFFSDFSIKALLRTTTQ